MYRQQSRFHRANLHCQATARSTVFPRIRSTLLLAPRHFSRRLTQAGLGGHDRSQCRIGGQSQYAGFTHHALRMHPLQTAVVQTTDQRRLFALDRSFGLHLDLKAFCRRSQQLDTNQLLRRVRLIDRPRSNPTGCCSHIDNAGIPRSCDRQFTQFTTQDLIVELCA